MFVKTDVDSVGGLWSCIASLATGLVTSSGRRQWGSFALLESMKFWMMRKNEGILDIFGD